MQEPSPTENTQTLPELLIERVKEQGKRFALADSSGSSVTYTEALQRAVFLANRIEKTWSGQERVGILVPPSVGGTLLNWAALLMGKVPVNLNYTLSQEGIVSCIEQCGLTHVVASEKLMSRLKFELPVEVTLIEDLAKSPGIAEKLKVASMTMGGAIDNLLERLGGAQLQPDDLATIIFSSGSTGDPKGVMLSHRNVVANLRQLNSVFSFDDDDCLLGVLPFFHSFGFTVTIGGPIAVGFGVAYHFNPMESKVIGPLIEEHRVTFLVATPTFLQFYLRGCTPEQLTSLRHAIVAAEKLPERVATAFEEKFGCRPLEAYGCTECAPAVTANGPEEGTSRTGSIGRALAGIELRVVDPESGEDVAAGEEGMLKVKGENVMRGYLDQPEKTAEVLSDGWYETGDIVRIDEDGFVWIAGRMSRFSKIAGEMVPHGNVEEKLHELAGLTEQSFAVAGVPCEKKGERLVVLHTLDEDAIDALMEKLTAADIPNLWKPKRTQFVAVEKLPYLGTGKLDLKGLQGIAMELS